MTARQRQFKQLAIAKQQMAKFQKALKKLANTPNDPEIHPVLQKAVKDALEGQLESLRLDVEELEKN